MRSKPEPAPTRKPAGRFLLASLLAFGLTTPACAPMRSSVVTVAPPPRLDPPPLAREPCRLSTLQGSEVGDLGVAYRERGVDVRECEGKRALAVQTLDTEHRLEDDQVKAREERARPLWKKLTPWRED